MSANTPTRKPPPANTNTPPNRVGDNSPSRSSVSGAVPSSSGQGLARTPSLRQTRPLRRPANRASSSFASGDTDADDQETKTANAQLILDLKEQVQRAEQASEQYRRQLEIMQQRLDEAASEQTMGEERDYQRQTDIDRLRVEVKELTRQRREVESAHEEDKRIFLQERERQANKEAELHAVIGRLTEALRTKSAERASTSRAASIAEAQAALEGKMPQQESNGQDFLQTLHQKDVAIEALRFELAEAQLKLAEQEHMGDGQAQSLEKALLEIKMQNARLVEENESFQMLLSEKTLKGGFIHDSSVHEEPTGMSTLAEEMGEDDAELHPEAYRKLEGENKTLRESNKALTLYIDKIVGRLLQHEGFEHIITDRDEPPKPLARANTEKALPPAPDGAPTSASTTAASVATGLLQRARSVVSRPGAKARPMSYAQPVAPTANENPETAPSIPIGGRGHRRARSDQAQTDMAAAAVVQQMNRGSPMRTVSGGPLSPGMRPLSPQISGHSRGSHAGAAGTRGSGDALGSSSANSVTSEHSDDRKSHADAPPTSHPGPSTASGPAIPGAIMKQNQLRPLRLVQEQIANEEEERKKANRGSWMGWLRGSTVETQTDQRDP